MRSPQLLYERAFLSYVNILKTVWQRPTINKLLRRVSLREHTIFFFLQRSFVEFARFVWCEEKKNEQIIPAMNERGK